MPPKDRPGADAGSAAPGYISVHSAPAPVRPDISQIIIVATMKRFFIGLGLHAWYPDAVQSRPTLIWQDRLFMAGIQTRSLPSLRGTGEWLRMSRVSMMPHSCIIR